MISSHLRDRFFQRYGVVLTVEILREVVAAAVVSQDRRTDNKYPDREQVWVVWNGHQVGLSWYRPKRIIFTFLPPRGGARLAWCVPKRKNR